MSSYDDSFEMIRRDRLEQHLEVLAEDLKVYKKDFIEGARVGKHPEDAVLRSTRSRIRLNDTIHELHKHLEEDWGVYDAERLYPQENLSNGDDTEDIANILGI
jgi:hypothetical protein